MSIATKQPQTPTMRRIWKVPTSRARWYWLGASVALYIGISAWYFYTLKTQQDPAPISDPLRLFGIISYVLVLGTVAYTLRRRFVRGLPGKVQNWLWMHTWVGMISILIAMMHANFAYITNSFSCPHLGCLTDTYWAVSALYSLIFLVVSGIVGRLLDVWQTHVIAHDASTNGVGIVRALEERALEMEYTIERLCAGKSETFKQFCLSALKAGARFDVSPALAQALPAIGEAERADFQQTFTVLDVRANLLQSLQKQRRARLIMRVWRYTHIVLASIAVLIITYHATMETLANVLHVITPA